MITPRNVYKDTDPDWKNIVIEIPNLKISIIKMLSVCVSKCELYYEKNPGVYENDYQDFNVYDRGTSGSLFLLNEARITPIMAQALKQQQIQAHVYNITKAALNAGTQASSVYASIKVPVAPLDFIKIDNIITDKAVDKCECGAYKVHKAARGSKTHSDWCGWSK